MAAAHQALSSSTELRSIVGTGTGRPGETAELSAARASEMLSLMGMAERVKVYPGVCLTLVWIGGEPYPSGGPGETNFGIDPLAAQFVFNETSVPMWQVPRNVYATCLVSDTELQAFVAPNGAIGAWLYGKVFEAARRWGGAINTGETYTLGDSHPL